MRQLVDYLPDILKDVREMTLLTADEDTELALINAKTAQALKDVYPETAGLYGIERWEQILGLPKKASKTTEERRAAIIARLNEILPYTDIQLRRMLFGITGSYENFVLTITGAVLRLGIDASVYESKQAILDMLERVLPMNIEYFINPSYGNEGFFYVGAAGSMGCSTTIKAR